ncbi:hypothetical protein ACFHYR_10665 [Pasteurella multocida]
MNKPMTRRATYNVTPKRRDMLERLAVQTSVKVKRTVKWTEIVSHAIDYYAEDSAKDIVHKIQE